MKLQSESGISLVSIIIFLAFLVAALNVYAYFNPDFQLSRYTFVYLLNERNEEERRTELAQIQEAVEAYYDENGEYPARDAWCGRIVTVLNPDVKDAIKVYFPDEDIPADPAFAGTHKDYFYRRENKKSYVLLAVLQNPSENEATFNYQGCYDWPGNDVYNYQIGGSR
jgi:hypothetical protein